MAAGTTGGAARRGPRQTDTAWRERILDAARREFGEHGYQGATVRRIGSAAGVDPKLVHYYFGTKEELFSTSIAEAFRRRGLFEFFEQALGEGAESPGTEYLFSILTALEDDAFGAAFIGLVRNLGTHEESRRIFLRFVTTQLIEQLAPRLDGPLPEARIAFAGSQLLGLVTARYILKLPPLAALSTREVARVVGPTLDRYIFGPLPLEDRAPTPGPEDPEDLEGPEDPERLRGTPSG